MTTSPSRSVLSIDVVEIGETGRTPTMQMWRGTMTVDRDRQSAGFDGTYVSQGSNGWTADVVALVTLLGGRMAVVAADRVTGRPT